MAVWEKFALDSLVGASGIAASAAGGPILIGGSLAFSALKFGWDIFNYQKKTNSARTELEKQNMELRRREQFETEQLERRRMMNYNRAAIYSSNAKKQRGQFASNLLSAGFDLYGGTAQQQRLELLEQQQREYDLITRGLA